MPRPRNSTEMRPALRGFLATALRNAHHFDAVVLARCQVLLAEDAAIRAVQFRDPAKGLHVAIEGRHHMGLVRRVSLQHLILRDQTLLAFGEEHLVTELDGCSHLAAFDQVGMGFEDRVDLLGAGNLLSFEHAAARLFDHLASQTAIGSMSLRISSRAMSASRSLPRVLLVFSSTIPALSTTSSAMPMCDRSQSAPRPAASSSCAGSRTSDDRILALTHQHRLPAAYAYRLFAASGGLLSE
jgi:hypothetical protein